MKTSPKTEARAVSEGVPLARDAERAMTDDDIAGVVDAAAHGLLNKLRDMLGLKEGVSLTATVEQLKRESSALRDAEQIIDSVHEALTAVGVGDADATMSVRLSFLAAVVHDLREQVRRSA